MIIAIYNISKAQVGIHTSSPETTLDIKAKNPTGSTKNVDGLLIPRVDRQRAQSMTGVPQSTLITSTVLLPAQNPGLQLMLMVQVIIISKEQSGKN